MENIKKDMTPVESALGESHHPPRRNSSDDIINDNLYISHSESSAHLIQDRQDLDEEFTSMLTVENIKSVNEKDIGRRKKVLMGHSSRTSMEILSNNQQEPISINEDIKPAVPANMDEATSNDNNFLKVDQNIPRHPPVSPHYIGYHPTKLYKVKDKLHNSEGIAFLPDDKLVIADKHDGHITLFDDQGHFEKVIAKGVKPCGVATNKSGKIAFTDVKDKHEKLIKVYTASGHKVSHFGSSFHWNPRGIAVSNKGLLVVTDIESKMNCIGVYTLEGKMISKFGHKGEGREELEEPLYVHVDVKDRILISDKGNHCVKVFDEKGNYLGKIGHRGSGDGALLNPRGITEDAYGHILVCDTGNRRVSAYTHEGHFIKHLLQASDGLQHPVDIAFSRSSGRLAVTMHKSNGDFHKLRVYQLPHIEELPKVNMH